MGGGPAPGGEASGEETRTLLDRPGLRVERIVSRGHRSPDGFWYDQDDAEWVMVVEGAAVLRFEGESEPRRMSAGDHVDIPAHVRHRVEWTDPGCETIWIAVHYRSRGRGDRDSR